MSVWVSFVFGLVGVVQVGYGDDNIINKYDNYSLVKLFPLRLDQIGSLHFLEEPGHNIEILKKSRSFNDSTDLLVPPDEVKFLQDFIKNENFVHEFISHYGRKFENLDRMPKRRLLRFSIYEYHGYTEIQEYIESMAKRYPDLIKLQNLGTSYQGRRMQLVKISSNPNSCNPIIFIDAGIHAREWVAPAMAIYIIHRLVNDPEAVKRELNGVDWYILPVVNPDGYEFTRTSRANRLWRKTRSKPTANGCYGVDGNRNYGFKWAVSGVSNNPCDKETYAGPKPFSEKETQMVRNIMMENSKRIKLYVSLHSYGQYLVYPWGYTGDYLPKQWRKLDTLAKLVSNAVQKAGGLPFNVLSAGKWYPAAGGSDDFAFGAVGIPYSYTMELTDGFEFIYPEIGLKPVLPQFYEGFKVFAAHIREEFPAVCRRRRLKTLLKYVKKIS